MTNPGATRRFSSTIVLMCIFAVFLSSFYPGGVYAGAVLVLMAVGAVLSYVPRNVQPRYLVICSIAAIWVGIVLYVTLTA